MDLLILSASVPGTIHWPVLLMAPLFWIYFHYMSVEPAGPVESGRVRLSRPFAFPPDVQRALLCIAPFAVTVRPEQHAFWMALALATAISPLQIPSVEPGPEHAASLPGFACRWAVAELDRWLKTLVLSGLFWLLTLLPFLQFLRDPAVLAARFRFVERIPGCLELPPWFYLVALFVLLIRGLMLHGISVRAAGRGMLSGIFVLYFFYNATGQVQLSPDNWESPVSGLAGAILFKLFASWSFARLDLMYTRENQ